MLLTANHTFPPRLFSVYTCDRYHCTHGMFTVKPHHTIKGKLQHLSAVRFPLWLILSLSVNLRPMCPAYISDFIVVRQPQVHTPCTSSDFRCQPHQQDVAHFPTQDCLSTTKTNSASFRCNYQMGFQSLFRPLGQVYCLWPDIFQSAVSLSLF